MNIRRRIVVGDVLEAFAVTMRKTCVSKVHYSDSMYAHVSLANKSWKILQFEVRTIK